jgi:hypothetical protein
MRVMAFLIGIFALLLVTGCENEHQYRGGGYQGDSSEPGYWGQGSYWGYPDYGRGPWR